MKTVATLLALAASLVLALPARAQDDKEALKKKILEQVEKKLKEEEKRILEEISKLIDEEIAKARGQKPPAPAPVPPPDAPKPPPAPGGGSYLGVQPDPDQPEEEQFKVWKVDGGVRILVKDGSPAEKAGLKDGDVIVELDGKKVLEWTDLPAMLGGRKPGDEVKIRYFRDKSAKDLTVTLGVRPAAPADAPPPPGEPPTKPPPPPRPGKLGLVAGDPTGKGMAIDSVGESTPAAKAGLKAGDILVKLDQTSIWKESDLAAFMKTTKPGQKVDVTITRDGQEKKFSVVLAGP